MSKNPVQPLQPEAVKAEVIPPVAFKPERSYTIKQVGDAIDAFYASKGNKTPASVDLYDLKIEVEKFLKSM